MNTTVNTAISMIQKGTLKVSMIKKKKIHNILKCPWYQYCASSSLSRHNQISNIGICLDANVKVMRNGKVFWVDNSIVQLTVCN